ncbi:MAG: hypothetical protein HQ562_10830 [Candidatus Marinimicrobia bacterium]|nr:hypothetical protein [Candidatus Neomarinimicrobiota bacterium]
MKIEKYSKKSLTINRLIIFTVLGALLLTVSCSLFEQDEDYSISYFDEGIAAGLMDNIYFSQLDTIKVINILTGDSIYTDANVDSLMAIQTDRQGIIQVVENSNVTITPSIVKYAVFTDTLYAHSFALLDLSAVTSTENLVIYFNNHLSPTIWDYDGNLVEAVEDGIPWGILTISKETKGRFEYSLSNEKYIIRFTRSEKLIKESVGYFELVALHVGAEPSTTAEAICGVLNEPASPLYNIYLPGLSVLDTNWIKKEIDYIYSSDSLRNLLVTRLEDTNAVITSADINYRIDFKKDFDVENSYMIMDLSDGTADTELVFYLSEYLSISIWGAVDSLKVPATGGGLTFEDVAACSNIRNKRVFQLANLKYLVGFSATSDLNKFRLVITNNE